MTHGLLEDFWINVYNTPQAIDVTSPATSKLKIRNVKVIWKPLNVGEIVKLTYKVVISPVNIIPFPL